MLLNILINNEKIVLSDECSVRKTESLIKETKHFREIDFFLSKLSEGIIINLNKFHNNKTADYSLNKYTKCYKIQTINKEHSFFFVFGNELKNINNIKKLDVVFFKYLGMESYSKKTDFRLLEFLKNASFNIEIQEIKIVLDDKDFQRLYRLSNSDYINFPLLSYKQKEIVTKEDENILVQGVAGSGKTNVCIEKLIYSACREYKGRILYSTFSRGLLIDIQNKVKHFQNNLKRFLDDYEKNNIVFVGSNKKKAIENKLGIYFTEEDNFQILFKIKQIISFLDNNVDYFLLEDFYVRYIDQNINIADENYFIKTYVKDIKNHQLTSKLDKINYLSLEVIYKEIYGVIFGCYNFEKAQEFLPFNEYVEKRKNSFSKYECEIIYSLAKDYYVHLKKINYLDNNLISRRLLEKLNSIKNYSLSILDEVQDMTEVNLAFIKSISIKMFCVGDALQMINPSYFSFAYLKRLLFKKNISSVAELSNNYRNSKQIADIVDKLGQINMSKFGTHSFVLKSIAIDSEVPTSSVYIKDDSFLKSIKDNAFNNYTIIVSSQEEKEGLRNYLLKQEILTVSEIKGLERDVVILYNILSSNFEKWKLLERTTVNRKQADENSVFRYYFNLFYVGISRARTHIFVNESKQIPLFNEFFANNFKLENVENAKACLLSTSSKTEIEQEEIFERIQEFLNLEQFDNARFTAGKLLNDKEREKEINKINIYEKYIKHGKHTDAGIKFWELLMYDEAKEQFILSGEETLCDLIDACIQNEDKGLNVDVIKYLEFVENNQTAKNVIFQTLKKDIEELKNTNKNINKSLKIIKENIIQKS